MNELDRVIPPDWVKDAIFYQIFPERFNNGDLANDPAGVCRWGDLPTRENFFGGDLQGVIDKLDYLQELGVNAIYLNPIFAARTNHRYDTSDYFMVDPILGDTDLLKELVRKVHQRGMHIILDGVFNHCGNGFVPFIDVVEKGNQSEFKDWFLARSYPLTTEPLNFLTCGGCTYLPKLNHAHRPVQEFILKVARYWLEAAEIDGWRLDVPFKIPLDFWREFRQVVKQVNPQAYLVGEVWREADQWVRGDVFDGVTNYRLRDILFDYVLTGVLDGEDFGYELQTLQSAHGTATSGMLNLLDSHDTTRVLTTFKGDVDRLRIALTAQMTLPGIPTVYYGDEVGLLGETDPDCRRCMPWDKKDWNLPVYQMTRDLIQLRHAHPALRNGKPQKIAAFNGMFSYLMKEGNDEVVVILNPREAIPDFSFKIQSVNQYWKEFQTGKSFTLQSGEIHLETIPARSALVLLPENH